MTEASTTQGKEKFGVHPEYTEHLSDWEAMEDAYEGEGKVKARSDGVRYLPFTPSQLLDGTNSGQEGLRDYNAYKMRATFPDYVTDAVETLTGMLHSKPAEIKLPTALESLQNSCTIAGESLQAFLRRINELQLCPGRCGILVDVNPETNLPYLSLYYAEDIVNWTDKNNVCDYVVLDESYSELDKASGNWVDKVKHRICQVSDGVYKSAAFEESDIYSEAAFKTIMLRGNTLPQLGFIFVNARDCLPNPDRAPLLGLARLCYTIYRSEADYRQNLFMQGQDTLVIIDANGAADAAPTRVGAGAKINVNIGGDAKYIGVDSQGLSEQRMAIENDRKQARARAGHFIASGQASQESGDALRTRLAALTATLNTVATTGAQALTKALEFCAIFVGASPDEIKVEENKEFFDIQLLGQDLELYMRAISEGAPLSPESVHNLLVKRGVAMFDFNTEIKKRDEQYKPAVAPTTPPSFPNPVVKPPATPPTAT